MWVFIRLIKWDKVCLVSMFVVYSHQFIFFITLCRFDIESRTSKVSKVLLVCFQVGECCTLNRGVNNSFQGIMGFGIFWDCHWFYGNISGFYWILWFFWGFFHGKAYRVLGVIYPSLWIICNMADTVWIFILNWTL